MIERRSDTYWMPRKSQNGTEQNPPKWIKKEDSGWIEIKESEQLDAFFPLHVRQVIAPDMEKFFVYVHQTNKAFAKGLYGDFVKQIEKELGETEYIILRYKNGITQEQEMNFYLLKGLVEKTFEWEIKEDFVNGKLTITKKKTNK